MSKQFHGAVNCTTDDVSFEFDSTADLIAAYESKYAGVYSDPEESERFNDCITAQSFGLVNGEDAIYDGGFADSGKGQLVLPYRHVEACYPGSMPGPAQGRGDCVSHSQKNAILTTLCCEVVANRPDEQSGKLEVAPEVSTAGIANGVLSTEAIYWYRDHGGDGWFCDHAARVVVEESGMWLRQNYPDLNLDLTKYNSKLAGKWGRTSPPSEVGEQGKQHLIRTSTRVEGFEQLRDFLHNGYGVSSCGSEGFSSSRNEDGVSSRRGTWYHAMAYAGADDRPETHRKYNGPLVLIWQSWGRGWNSGPRKILGTNQEIPQGFFWARWKDVSRRSMFAFSGANGWPAQELPPTFTPDVWG